MTGPLLPPDPSWDELAARAGIEPPMLAPGDHPMNVLLDAALYWPSGTGHPLQERRRTARFQSLGLKLDG